MLKAIDDFFQRQDVRIYGHCSLSNSDKEKILLSRNIVNLLNSAIVFGIPLSGSVIRNIEDGPDLLYLHHYRQANYLLDRISFGLAALIEECGYMAVPIPASQIVDWKNQRAHISHKHFALLSGLGWLGRNNLIVNSVYRSRLRFATVLTSIKVEAESKILNSGCGNCRRCIKMCPAGAITETPEGFNHIACFEKIKELTRQRNISQYICGICIKACEKWE